MGRWHHLAVLTHGIALAPQITDLLSEMFMRPLGMIGVLLVVLGVVVLAMRGISYTKDRDSVNVGPVQISADKKGFVPPVAGGIAIVAGFALVVAGRRKAA